MAQAANGSLTYVIASKLTSFGRSPLAASRSVLSQAMRIGSPVARLATAQGNCDATQALIEAIEIGSETEAICELFAPRQSSLEFEYLRDRAETPLQVPYHFLALLQEGISSEIAGDTKPTADQVEMAYRAILQRPPEDSQIVRHHVERCASRKELICSILSSEEAIERMPQLFARAFPMARLLWHVHIPKTAGTSFFAAAAESGWGYVNTNILSGAVGNVRRMASAVRLPSRAGGRAIISGHWHLTRHIEYVGPFDQVVAFVRDPVEHCISEFNFGVDVVNGRRNVHAADSALFLQRGLQPESFQETYRRGYFAANMQCSYLAADARCATALKHLSNCNAELLPAHGVNRAIAKLFPGSGPKRANVSNPHVRTVDLGRALREEILVLNGHDCLLNTIAESRFYQGHKRQSHAPPATLADRC